jgi:hypothetical protein
MRAFFEGTNRAFATWVSGRTYRLAPLIIVGLLVLPPMAWALSILDVLRRGLMPAFVSVFAASVGLAIAAMIGGSNPVNVLLLSLLVLVAGVALGAVLRKSGNLTLAFQATVVGTVMLVLVVFSLWPGANQLGAYIRQELLAFLEAGGVAAGQLAQFEALDGSLFTRAFLFMLEIMLLSALMLGYWWYSLVEGDARFGAAFRALKLGRVAGILLMVLVTLQLFVGAQSIQYAASLALVGFLFQGLAVLHARSHSAHWHWIVVFLVYVSLITPLAGIVIMGISVAGLLDNFFQLRAPSKRLN